MKEIHLQFVDIHINQYTKEMLFQYAAIVELNICQNTMKKYVMFVNWEELHPVNDDNTLIKYDLRNKND